MRRFLSVFAVMLACLAPQAEAVYTPLPDLSKSFASQAYAPEPDYIIETVQPLGQSHDGSHLDLVVLVAPETHTRAICVVQSPLGLATRFVEKRNADGMLIGFDTEYYAPTGEPGTGYSLDAFNFIAGAESEGRWDDFDRRFQHVISRASRPYRFGDLSELELREAINRGYVKEMDWPLIATRDRNGDWLVGKTGREAITEVAITACASVYFGTMFGEFSSAASASTPRYCSSAARSPVWKSRPPGVQVRRVAGAWVKRVNPNAPRIFQRWGRMTIQKQADALAKLHAAGRPAARFGYLPRSGYLAVEDVSPTFTKSGYFNPQYWRAWYQDSKAIGFVNDLRPENYGAGFRAFDPALDPVTIGVAGVGGTGLAGAGTYVIYNLFDEDE